MNNDYSWSWSLSWSGEKHGISEIVKTNKRTWQCQFLLTCQRRAYMAVPIAFDEGVLNWF